MSFGACFWHSCLSQSGGLPAFGCAPPGPPELPFSNLFPLPGMALNFALIYIKKKAPYAWFKASKRGNSESEEGHARQSRAIWLFYSLAIFGHFWIFNIPNCIVYLMNRYSHL